MIFLNIFYPLIKGFNNLNIKRISEMEKLSATTALTTSHLKVNFFPDIEKWEFGGIQMSTSLMDLE